MFYIVGLYFAVTYTTMPWIQVVHNSRFFPVLSLLPAMHILLLMLRREFFFGGGNNIIFPGTSYSQLKALFDRLNESDEHTITLKQAGSSN